MTHNHSLCICPYVCLQVCLFVKHFRLSFTHQTPFVSFSSLSYVLLFSLSHSFSILYQTLSSIFLWSSPFGLIIFHLSQKPSLFLFLYFFLSISLSFYCISPILFYTLSNSFIYLSLIKPLWSHYFPSLSKTQSLLVSLFLSLYFSFLLLYLAHSFLYFVKLFHLFFSNQTMFTYISLSCLLVFLSHSFVTLYRYFETFITYPFLYVFLSSFPSASLRLCFFSIWPSALLNF